MKRLCFGSLFKLMAMAKGSGITEFSLCESLLAAAGTPQYGYSKEKASRLKSCKENVPIYTINDVRSTGIEKIEKYFEDHIVCLINANKRKQLVLSLVQLIREDTTIDDSTIVGANSGYEKKNIISADRFTLASFLANIFVYAVKETENVSCAPSIQEITHEYFLSFDNQISKIEFDVQPIESSTKLSKTILDKHFDTIFEEVSSVTVTAFERVSIAKIYRLRLANDKFQLRDLKKFLYRNLGRYVYSRARYDRFKNDEELESVGAYALQLLKKEGEKSEEGLGIFLGEMLLYSFLEHALNAPKILSKIELSQSGGAFKSKSDGVHLLTALCENALYHKLVFGASNVVGDIRVAIDNAFEKVVSVSENSDTEFQVVENTIYGSVFDAETNNYLMSIIKPSKNGATKPETAFGIFIGYTVNLNRYDYPDMTYERAINAQLQKDIQESMEYIKQRITDLQLSGYSFYYYVLPFNDAIEEKNQLMDDIAEGRVM